MIPIVAYCFGAYRNRASLGAKYGPFHYQEVRKPLGAHGNPPPVLMLSSLASPILEKAYNSAVLCKSCSGAKASPWHPAMFWIVNTITVIRFPELLRRWGWHRERGRNYMMCVARLWIDKWQRGQKIASAYDKSYTLRSYSWRPFIFRSEHVLTYIGNVEIHFKP